MYITTDIFLQALSHKKVASVFRVWSQEGGAVIQTLTLIVLSGTHTVFLILHAHVTRAATFLATVVMTSWTLDALVSSVLET